MKKFKNILLLVLFATFFGTLNFVGNASAELPQWSQEQIDNKRENLEEEYANLMQKNEHNPKKIKEIEKYYTDTKKDLLELEQETIKRQKDPDKVNNSNGQASSSDVSGCSKDTGLFSGLIISGNKIFSGLRDLIYVVAGFGIVGVAVGGFFGSLNWKWLGAIVIGLILIASTGELINAITGCEKFTQGMISDTLK